MANDVTTILEPGESDDGQFRVLVDSIEDYGIFMLDLQGCVCSWNKGATAIKGYTKEEIIGQHFSVFYTQDAVDANVPAAELEFVSANGRFEDEGWRRRKDGSVFWANIIITARRNHEGVLIGYSKISRDMTGRKRLEESRFRNVVESAPNAMIMIDAQGRIELVNTQAERLFDYDRAEMLGQMVEILLPERFRHAHPGNPQLFFGDLQSRSMGEGRDLFGRRKDGSEFPIEIGLNPIKTEEGMMVLSAIVDISDRKQKEEKVQEALREKDVLLGEIHHRVKNNLQVIHSLLSLQSSMIDDEAVKGMLMDSQNRIQSMALIHQTLYQSNNFARVDFADFLEALVPTLVNSYGIDAAKIKLKINAGSVFLPINSAIPCGLLINELITNALKHAFPEGKQGEVCVALSTQVDNQILLVVSDNGVGISDDLDMDQIETLGLRLVSLLSQQLGGTLTIQRRHPTQFSLVFPLLDH